MIYNKDELQFLLNAVDSYSYLSLSREEANAEEFNAMLSIRKKLSKDIERWENDNPVEKNIDDKFFKFMNIANFYETKDYQLSMDNTNSMIEVTGGIIEEFQRVRTSKELTEAIDEEVDAWLDCGKQVENNIKICSICGAPMQEGYTTEDGDMFIDTDIEFFNYMNSIYGKNNWRKSTEKELEKYEANYVYKNSDSDEWLPSPWFYTDFY